MIGPQPAGERVLLPRAGTGKPQAAAAASLWRRNAVTWTSSVPKRDGSRPRSGTGNPGDPAFRVICPEIMTRTYS